MKKMSINPLVFILISILTRILMDYVYINYMVEEWEYQGFMLDVNMQKVIISYLSLLCLLFILNLYIKEKFSHFFVVLLFYTMYMPIGVIYGYMNKSDAFFIMVNLSFLLLALSIVMINRKSRFENENYDFETTKLYPILILISIYTFIAMTIQNLGNLNLSNVLSFTKVYSVREFVTYNWGMTYFFTWQTKVINPYLIAINYKKKKKIPTLLFILFQIWLYILTGHKLVIFTLFVIIIIIKFTPKLYNLPYILGRGLLILYSIAIIEIVTYQSSLLIDQLLRRVFYFPALLSFYYYDFFSNHGLQYWKYSMFGRIVDAQTDFNVLPSYVIGEIYFNNSENNAVAGYLGSEYMNGGVFGILIATLIIISLFIFIDKYVEKLNKELVLITFIAPLYTLWNTNLLTAFLSGGIFLSIIILSQTRAIKKIT
jgi:hypothetical protein